MSSRFTLLLLLIIYSTRVDACTCVRKGAEWTFERAEFVSRVLIENTENIEEYGRVIERIYTVKHLEVYKAPEGKRPTQVLTAGDQGTCGVALSKGQEVLLAGSIRGSYLQIGLCSHGIINRADAERLRLQKQTECLVSRVLVLKANRTPTWFVDLNGVYEYRGHDSEMVYTVKHLDVYKLPNSTLDLPTEVRTAGEGALCGVGLRVNQRVVLAGD